MKLQPKYYDFIKNGTKRVELRLYNEKRSKIDLNDVIKFSKSDNDKFNAKVIGLLRYSKFKDLFNDFDVSILADKSMSKQNLLEALGKFYDQEEQSKYGVVGIRIQLK